MGNYTGVKCPVCQSRFAARDDIVVCPLCGAPHHRECYAEHGQCAFTADHISGKEWRPPVEEREGGTDGGAEDQSGTKPCGRCNADNPPATLFCQVCGHSMTAANPNNAAGPNHHARNTGPFTHYSSYFSQVEDAYFDGITAGKEPLSGLPAKDVAVYIGPNCSYYLPHFYQIEKQEKAMQFNFAACLFSFLFYFYRKMYRVGLAMLAVFMVCLIPLFMFTWEMLPAILHQAGVTGPPTVQLDLQRATMLSTAFFGAMFVYFGISLALSFSANRIYHKQAVTKIRELLREHQGSREYRTALSVAGGVDRVKVMLISISTIVFFNIITMIMAHVADLL